MQDTVIHNARVIDPKSGIDMMGYVRIQDGLIAALEQGSWAEDGFAGEVVDARGAILMPGVVDAAVHIPKVGMLRQELHAAASAGVVAVVCWPDTKPVLDEPGLVEMLAYRAAQLHATEALPKVLPLGALTQGLQGKALSELVALQQAGCIGFTHADVPLADTQVLLRAMQYAATHGQTLWLQPRDPWLGQGAAATSAQSLRMGLHANIDAAETIALFTVRELMRSTGARVHLCRVSAAASIALVQQAKQEGLPLTCDVSVQHLHLSEEDLGYYDSGLHMQPPLRGRADMQALRAALADGTIDMLVSDHRPISQDAKMLPYAQSAPGCSSVELLLSLCFMWAQEDNIPLVQALQTITCVPAAVIGMNSGFALGLSANLCLFDPQKRWNVDAHALQSAGKMTPFNASRWRRAMQGKVRATWVQGRKAYASLD